MRTNRSTEWRRPPWMLLGCLIFLNCRLMFVWYVFVFTRVGVVKLYQCILGMIRFRSSRISWWHSSFAEVKSTKHKSCIILSVTLCWVYPYYAKSGILCLSWIIKQRLVYSPVTPHDLSSMGGLLDVKRWVSSNATRSCSTNLTMRTCADNKIFLSLIFSKKKANEAEYSWFFLRHESATLTSNILLFHQLSKYRWFSVQANFLWNDLFLDCPPSSFTAIVLLVLQPNDLDCWAVLPWPAVCYYCQWRQP